LLAACGSDTKTSTSSVDTSDPAGSETTTGDSEPTGSSSSSCEAIPEETGGPFPGDGTNGPNARALDGAVREDIRSSVGGASGSVEGVDCRLELTVVDATTCSPLAGAAVYAWHCDAIGRYSMYDDGVTDENWLRGVGVADDSGVVRFTTVFPGCYPGRWPHVHFEVFDDVTAATGTASPIVTSQLAFPQSECELVYADDRYGDSASSLRQLSLDSDGVFADDGAAHQVATMWGSAAAGYVAALRIPI
jgi:protocatechuate 3,4-dioxygenase beta subunit